MYISDYGFERNKTLGELMEDLNKNSARKVYWRFYNWGSEIPLMMGKRAVDSYRGFYDQIALEYAAFDSGTHVCERELYEELESFKKEGMMTGYKGGDYPINDECPLWLSSYGNYDRIAIVKFERVEDSKYILECLSSENY